MAKYWISVRAMSGSEFTDAVELGATKYLKVPDDETPAPRHRIPMSQWTSEIIASFPNASAPPAGGDPVPTGDVVFFVHGYNNTIENVNRAYQKLHQGLSDHNFQCQVICFDWPSGNEAWAYLRDLGHARATAIRLVNGGVKLFVTALTKDCNIRVHVLGHSMGAFVVREAFDHADDGMATTAANWTANQLVLFSGDVDAPSFAENDADTESLYRHCYRLTNYFNGHDEILQISNVKRFGVEPRVGRVGLPPDAPEKAVNVDCSDYFQQTYGSRPDIGKVERALFSHSWYVSDEMFMRDLAITLLGTVDREKIPTRGPGPGRTQILNGARAQPLVAPT
jgi:pimeloyl-ACP methyl ester carboxylesterase